MKKSHLELLDSVSPVEKIDTGSKHTQVKAGMALCLSGGGYRAMLFHVGALWRINEAGLLKKLDRISSVSGGSVTAAVLGMNWDKLDFDTKGIAHEFVSCVVDPIRTLAGTTVDVLSVAEGMIMPGMTINDVLANSYRAHLFGNATLQDFPDHPRFVINATNVQSGALWRFMKPYMADWRVGRIKRPHVSLAAAVAASSAFPPFLSPMTLKLQHSAYTPKSGKDLQREPFTTNVVLTDGGVYDNLGIETAWKLYDTILVSDGGGKMEPDPKPRQDWLMHYLRITDLIDNQVRNFRKGQVVDSFINGSRKGAYWGIRTNVKDYELADSLRCDFKKTMMLAHISTRMAELDSDTQERLINWGYAVCDAALRKHVNVALPRPDGFVYPKVKV